MIQVGAPEDKTQNRLIDLFQQQLGYRYDGNWKDRAGNQNIEEALLRSFLEKRYEKPLVDRAISELKKVASNLTNGLYEANKKVYHLLRYGVKVQEEVGRNHQTVYFIDWENPEVNDFSISEEVTVVGRDNTKRPDLVIYVNGIALGVFELKRGKVAVSEGIRQNLDNQSELFIRHFFTTIQLVFAGNNTQGLHYGMIETREKYWLRWKEEGAQDKSVLEIDRSVLQMCAKARFLELIHDFIAFDRGIKKACRPNQYFGVKAAQQRIAKRDGGIIWHTQGSGKSLTMVWLTKWIREHQHDARVLLITDRDELDKQIEKVFLGVEEDIHRTKSGKELIKLLDEANPALICSLIHKFGLRNNDEEQEGDVASFIEELRKNIPANFKAKGNIFVFVDECHRTQSGDLHKAMKQLLPDALFIGFTGTPLLKKDKQTSIEVFGTYIHTYKFNEAVEDGVVLDLQYEPRDIEQYINQPQKIDEWFAAKTKGLTSIAVAQLKQKWGTLRNVFSSQERLQRIVADICLDMETKPRLQNGRGNAMLVTDSIYQACRVYEMFQHTALKDKCAIVTSYKPNITDAKGQQSGEGTTEKLKQYEIYNQMLNGESPEAFEDRVKNLFINEPAQMKLLIVVDKLLTGFDAPSATYLYIDKKMQDHGLFQAICRVNRLDGDDKEYGYIIDYKDLFGSLEKAVDDYTTEAFAGYEKQDVEGLLSNRLKTAKEDLDNALEAVKALCEPVRPQTTEGFIHYFVTGGKGTEEQLLKEQEENVEKRLSLYTLVASLIRKYASIANEMVEAGYTAAEAGKIKEEVKFYSDLRDEIKLASGDYVDLKLYEPGMRQMLDLYIRANDSEPLVDFDELSLIQLVSQEGEEALTKLPKAIREKEEAVAETLEANMRKLIIDESPTNPAFFEEMSKLLQGLIKERHQKVLDYKEYLEKIIALSKKVAKVEVNEYPAHLNTAAVRALYDNLDKDVDKALLVDKTIVENAEADWMDNRIKRKKVKIAVRKAFEAEGYPTDDEEVEQILKVAEEQEEYKIR